MTVPATGIAASALLVFTLSIDDYVITSFVAGVGATTLPLHIYSMLKVGVTPEVNAVSTLLLAVTVVLIVLAHRLLQSSFEEGWPPEITWNNLRPYYQMVDRTLEPRTVPPIQWSERVKLLKEAADRNGWNDRFQLVEVAVQFAAEANRARRTLVQTVVRR